MEKDTDSPFRTKSPTKKYVVAEPGHPQWSSFTHSASDSLFVRNDQLWFSVRFLCHPSAALLSSCLLAHLKRVPTEYIALLETEVGTLSRKEVTEDQVWLPG